MRSAKVLRFGPNELDLRVYELRRAGRRLPLSKLPLDLLILLVEQRGGILTREQIVAQLWQDPGALDTDAGINNAINRIRGVLGDDRGRPRYIETVIGAGYRFIAPVEEVPLETASLPLQAADAPVVPVSSQRRSRALWVSLAATALLLVAVTGWMIFKRNRKVPDKKLEPIQITTNESNNPVSAAAISPDGKLLAYADPDGLFLRFLANGSTHPLRIVGDVRLNRIEWFPDNIHLLLSGSQITTARNHIWMASILDADWRLIRDDAQNGTPSPDGSKLAFTANNDSEIWVAGPNGEHPRLFSKDVGGVFSFIFWAAGGKRLSFQRHRFAPSGFESGNREVEINYVGEYGSRDLASGRQVYSAENILFESACVTSRGRMFYLRTKPWKYASLRGIWEVQTDEKSGAFLSSPRLLASLGEDRAYGLSASADGKQIAAVSERGQPDVYIADLQQPGPALVNIRRLTSDSKRDFPHAWTRDSESVIFESDREGAFHIFRQRLDQHTAEKLTDAEGQQVLAQLAPNSNSVLYVSLKGHIASSSDLLFRVGLDGGAPAQVPLGGTLDEFRCPLHGASCVLRETLDHRQYVFYELNPVSGRGRELARTSWIQNAFGDWALSPDGATVALPYHDRQPAQIRLVPLQTGSRRESEIQVRGIGVLWGLNWAANGAGWFAEIRRAGTPSLAYIDAAGHISVLRETGYNTWGIPSPDGRKLAFVDYTADRNVWLWR